MPDNEPIIPRTRMITDPVVPTVMSYVALRRAADHYDNQALVDFYDDIIQVYEKHDMDNESIWNLNWKMVNFCSELLTVHEKHDMSGEIEWSK